MTATIERLLTLEEARARMLDGVDSLPAEDVGLEEALDRVLAEPLISKLTLPPWDNSAMDGFAVRAEDVSTASATAPVVLRVYGEVAAGRAPDAFGNVPPGGALRILTGAPLPPGADTVVPVEDTDAPAGVADLPTEVAIHAARPAGAHIRLTGSDLRVGDVLLDAGTAVTPAGLAIAAAGGHGSLTMHHRPKVAVFASGDELVPPGTPLGEAQIPDSNSIALASLAQALGAEARSLGIAPDSLEAVTGMLEEAIAWADVIVVSGGVSVGAHDVVKEAFARVGRMDLWRVAVQPGKPVAFGRARRPDGAQVLLFGLPGNPVSSQVTFELFVRPVLRRLAGHVDVIGRESVRARLGQPVHKSAGRRAFLRVRLTNEGARWRADLAGGQDSHMLSALARADGLAIIPEAVDALAEGAEVEVIRLR